MESWIRIEGKVICFCYEFHSYSRFSFLFKEEIYFCFRIREKLGFPTHLFSVTIPKLIVVYVQHFQFRYYIRKFWSLKIVEILAELLKALVTIEAQRALITRGTRRCPLGIV